MITLTPYRYDCGLYQTDPALAIQILRWLLEFPGWDDLSAVEVFANNGLLLAQQIKRQFPEASVMYLDAYKEQVAPDFKLYEVM